MQNTLLWISYDGTAYSGFQIQANAPTIQEEIEKALAVVYKQPLRINGAGRTDAGVHARGQAANFIAPFKIEPDKLPHALNSLLPNAIVITGAEEVAEGFHARFDAVGKKYSYTIDRALHPQVLWRLYSWHQPDPFDSEALKVAAGLFIGEHNFAAFQAAGSTVTDTIRTLNQVEPILKPAEQLLTLCFEGSGFLYHMVRLITGTLVRVAKGELEPAQVDLALRGLDKNAVGPTMPARGLCLEQVIYQLQSDKRTIKKG
ncbi:MAG: tRNA pseudouridine(38-40) synthase TruA [Firmicutes bacterium]|nr:tRNA pseudouridine(38-40) synthase TruA [Bacillota bacterium]